MIEIPSDLHPDLVPLAFLLGNWEGAGVADFPGTEKCNFGQEVTFSHDGRDFLEYTSHTWVLDAEGKKVRPLESESGYWRIDADRKVEVVDVPATRAWSRSGTASWPTRSRRSTWPPTPSPAPPPPARTAAASGSTATSTAT